jgi:hypothetical protein
VATDLLLAITADHGSELPPLTIFAMGSVAERYRDEAADLLSSMTRRLKVLNGREWIALEEVMAARRDDALAATPPPRTRTRSATPRPAGQATGTEPASGPGAVLTPPGTGPEGETPGTPDRIAAVTLAVLVDDPEPALDQEQPDHPAAELRTDQSSPSKVALVAYQEPPPPTEVDPEGTRASVRNVGEV